jgi:hypothetical protein
VTRIDSTLSANQIGHAIVYPTAPMLSFKNLPAIKLKDVVEFFAQLRDGLVLAGGQKERDCSPAFFGCG